MSSNAIRAAGTIFVSLNTGRVYLQSRSTIVKYPNTWAFCGGKIHFNEGILGGLSREIREEIGFVPEHIAVYPMDWFRSDESFMFFSFVVFVLDEFIPILNEESHGWGWFSMNCLPKPLHPGAAAVLNNQTVRNNLEQMIQDVKDSIKN